MAIRGGNLRSGFAETTVMRAHFGPSSGTCVITKNFNALDLWIWYSVFDRCRRACRTTPAPGISASITAFPEVGQSRYVDPQTGGFNIRNNTSIGSTAFWDTSPPFAYPAHTTIQGNKLIHDSHPAILIRNQGPALLIDNQIESPSKAAGPVVAADALGDTDLLSAGNVYTTPHPVAAKGRYITFDDKIAGSLHLKEPSLPGTPRDLHRHVFEVPKGAGAAEIQRAINAAASSGLPRPVVHIPEATYRVDVTLEIPRGSDLQIVGDGYTVTRLNWAGEGAGPVFHVTGPGKAIFREVGINGSKSADGITIDGIDQPGSRVHMQQAQIGSTSAAGLFVDGLDYTNVDLRNIGHSGIGLDLQSKLQAAGLPQQAIPAAAEPTYSAAPPATMLFPTR